MHNVPSCLLQKGIHFKLFRQIYQKTHNKQVYPNITILAFLKNEKPYYILIFRKNIFIFPDLRKNTTFQISIANNRQYLKNYKKQISKSFRKMGNKNSTEDNRYVEGFFQKKQQDQLFKKLIALLRKYNHINGEIFIERLQEIDRAQEEGRCSLQSIKFRERQLEPQVMKIIQMIRFPKFKSISIFQETHTNKELLRQKIVKILSLEHLREAVQNININLSYLTRQSLQKLFSLEFPKLTKLQIGKKHQTDNVKILLDKGKNFPNLKELNMQITSFYSNAGEKILAYYTQCEQFPWKQLQTLNFYTLQLSGYSIKNIKNICQMTPKVKQINFKGNQMSSIGAHFLAECPWKKLTSINLNSNNIGPEGAKGLSKGKWPKLSKILLDSNNIKDEGLGYLCQGKWPQISFVSFDFNYIGKEGCQHLMKANWKNLKTIYLQNNAIDDEGIEYLMQAQWPLLRKLVLGQNIIDDYAMEKFRHASWPNLQQLSLAQKKVGTKIGSLGIEDLFSKKYENFLEKGISLKFPHLEIFKFSNLRQLDCSNNSIGDYGVSVICYMKFPQLIKINLHDNSLTDKCIRSFEKTFWPNLQDINLGKNEFTDKMLKYLSVQVNWKNLEILTIDSSQITLQGLLYFGKNSFPFLKSLSSCSKILGNKQHENFIEKNFCGKNRRGKRSKYNDDEDK